ncbi:hypothetical protein CROQUDRAFT_65197 [Cronartium quercuum f. sp. fusiforme G11]|uniref:Photolyase/cryptochrome alpha/beta domain-containing protein n=1 Tax=Cronartium quercuum f. sp. fusiforme G11 TaxID=708437 RepID=A0A9P6NHN4_9BASI|nr:hypothetical protein CROQUDRAFT_65197 [Cronartium quercuum f. sp. fusiforme G11]
MPTLKRTASTSLDGPDTKKPVKNGTGTAAPATGIAEDTPYQQLLMALESHKAGSRPIDQLGDKKAVVVYWMRMRDLRLSDNRALASASDTARSLNAHLVVLHIFSPGDYRAHDRSARRIDFVLRNLVDLRQRLSTLHVPLYTLTIEKRKTIPERVVELLTSWDSTHIFGNIEHEIDELRRDIHLIELCEKHMIQVDLLHDTCVVEPGRVLTKENKPYSIFSPWQKNWANIINQDLSSHIDAAPDCKPNDPSATDDSRLANLFEVEIPASIPGFELAEEDRKNMESYWKAGEAAAQEMLEHFMTSPLDSKEPKQATLQMGSTKLSNNGKADTPTIVDQYSTLRNRPDLPGTSCLSAYLAAGVISPRACLRASLEVKEKGKKSKKLQVDRRELGVGMWQSELGWREFYQHVLAAWPRVSMGKSFNEKYEKMVWEWDETKFEAWKAGQTGYPFIDACMRQLKEMGYMHNRGRMCVAMFLTKDLMMDWRTGEQWFMVNLVDGDLGSNNGGWQWSASTGVDAQPYFRIFAPLAQSEKSDPNGDFIRQYVPELKSLSGKAIHDPYHVLPPDKFKKLGYPKPIVDHAVVRKRALARYKNPGCTSDE